jgi:hypothetical protein
MTDDRHFAHVPGSGFVVTADEVNVKVLPLIEALHNEIEEAAARSIDLFRDDLTRLYVAGVAAGFQQGLEAKEPSDG